MSYTMTIILPTTDTAAHATSLPDKAIMRHVAAQKVHQARAFLLMYLVMK